MGFATVLKRRFPLYLQNNIFFEMTPPLNGRQSLAEEDLTEDTARQVEKGKTATIMDERSDGLEAEICKKIWQKIDIFGVWKWLDGTIRSCIDDDDDNNNNNNNLFYYQDLYSQEPSIHSQMPKMSIFLPYLACFCFS